MTCGGTGKPAGYLTEGRRILTALLDRLDPAAPIRPRALWVTGFLALVQADLPAARNLLEAGLAAAEEAGDIRSVSYASSQLGFVRYYLGEVDRGYALAEKSLMLARQSADQVGVVPGLTQLGFIDLLGGNCTKPSAGSAKRATGRRQWQRLVPGPRAMGARDGDMAAWRPRWSGHLDS